MAYLNSFANSFAGFQHPKGREISRPYKEIRRGGVYPRPHFPNFARGSTLANLRVVRDADSPTGWKLTHDPFPGWETVPVW